MIVTETFTLNDKTYIHTYSDSGYKIYGGNPEGEYDEAIDPESAGRTYTETTTPVDEEVVSMGDIKTQIITETINALI